MKLPTFTAAKLKDFTVVTMPTSGMVMEWTRVDMSVPFSPDVVPDIDADPMSS